MSDLTLWCIKKEGESKPIKIHWKSSGLSTPLIFTSLTKAIEYIDKVMRSPDYRAHEYNGKESE